ncbi:hypothetical protein SO802_016250 [Lithocarpus litseifolius]|uniref:S-acyltransferase n=1 Tax=Lithocarpus litseifolius TaxID=425828 RepID=A0AAW2CYH1_9ROSI
MLLLLTGQLLLAKGDVEQAFAAFKIVLDGDRDDVPAPLGQIFFLQGRFIFGPDVRSLGLTIFLIVAPVAVFCVFVARKLMDVYSNHWGVSIMVVSVVFTIYIVVLLLLTCGRDPGIIPRNAHPPEPEGFDGNVEVGASQTPQLRLPRIKEVEVNGVTIKIKYCDTCMLYRPPRCSHCSICNNCVERFDHHCPWGGQCIGRVYIRRIMEGEQTSIWKAMIKTPASIVLIVYTFISMWFVGGLTAFHLYLINPKSVDTDMDAKVKAMIKLIEEAADSIARRAEMYYKKRPELMKLVEEFYRAYRALAERYDHAELVSELGDDLTQVATKTEVLVSILGDDLTQAAELVSELWNAKVKAE